MKFHDPPTNSCEAAEQKTKLGKRFLNLLLRARLNNCEKKNSILHAVR